MLSGCDPVKEDKTTGHEESPFGDYGRTDEEKAHDLKISREEFLNEHEMETVESAPVLREFLLRGLPHPAQDPHPEGSELGTGTVMGRRDRPTDEK